MTSEKPELSNECQNLRSEDLGRKALDSLVRTVARREAIQADEQCADACKKLAIGEIPTPAWIIEFFAENPRADHYRLLSSHVFWPEYRLRTGLEHLHQVARHACTDFISNEAAIAPFDLGGTVSSMQSDIGNFVYAAQKDLIAYCSAASAFNETLETLIQEKDVAGLEQLGQIRRDCFCSPVGFLIRLLRNSLLHTRNVDTSWLITYNPPDQHGRTLSSVLRLTDRELQDIRKRDLASRRSPGEHKMRTQQWKQAFSYLDETSRTDTRGKYWSLSNIMADHFTKLNSCFVSTSKWLVSNISPIERDFYTLLRSRSQVLTGDKGENAKLFVEHLEQNTNLGRALSDFFNPAEVHKILCWPGDSQSQGRYIMALLFEGKEFTSELQRSLFASLERLRP